MKFDFVAKHRGAWPIETLCEAIGVSRSGFYAWLSRPRSERSLADEVLGAKVFQSFVASDRTYGARRVWHDVLELGYRCGLHRVERLMRAQALKARPRRRGLPADRGQRSAIADNVLDRQFHADAPNQKWVADALMMAVWRRGKPEELLHHSDQGSQYTSEHFQKLLAAQGITCSMSRAGEVWDNSAMESFFSTLKIERVHRKVYRTRAQARADVFDFIEAFYNPKRRHSTIGYISPVKFEEALFA